MTRRYSFPEGHWDWPVKLTHHHAVRAGDMVFTGGQVDLDSLGTVRSIGDLDAQVRNSMAYTQDLLADLGVGFTDLVRLVVYYVGGADDEARLLDLLAGIIGPEVKPVVNLISLPELCYPGMLCEIEGVAMRAPDGSALPRRNYHLDDLPFLPQAFSHMVACGGMIFTGDMSARCADGSVAHPGDIAAQTRLMMERLSPRASGCRSEDAGCGQGQHILPRRRHGGRLGNLCPHPRRLLPGTRPGRPPAFPYRPFPMTGLTTPHRRHCLRSRGARVSGTSGPAGIGTGPPRCLTNTVSPPASLSMWAARWRWMRRPKVLEPGDMVAQTRIAMDNAARVLEEFGATLDDVVKVTTFYQGSASAEALHENLLIRSNSYSAPGPCNDRYPGAQSGLRRHGDRDRGDRDAREPHGSLISRHKIQPHSEQP